MTKDNCRLLFLRLKMEGWALGKTKVFLRYYNDEFLARWAINSYALRKASTINCFQIVWAAGEEGHQSAVHDASFASTETS